MVDKTKLNERLRRLKRWIRDDRSVREMYDIDGDGKISGEEWDLAKQKVISSLESEEAPARLHETEEGTETLPEKLDEGGAVYGQIRVESFWGAIAMFCLCQIYYFILFEGFVFVSGAPATHRKLLYVWFGVLFLVSVSAQIEAMIKIENFFADKPFSPQSFRIASIEDFIKCLLAVTFTLFFILFCLGFYPFPSKPHSWWHTLLFYIFIWGLTAAAAKNLRGGIKSSQPLGVMNVIPVLMGFGFFTAGAFLGEVFYFAGTFGMGFALIPIRPLLLCDQTRLWRQSKSGQENNA
jgi:hypothetical protein